MIRFAIDRCRPLPWRRVSWIAAVVAATIVVGCGQEMPRPKPKIDDKKETTAKDKQPDIILPRPVDPPTKTESKKSDDPAVVKAPPRMAVEPKFISVPVYYGTNRKPKADYETNLIGEFGRFFWPPSRATLGLLFIAGFALTVSAIAFGRWRHNTSPASSKTLLGSRLFSALSVMIVAIAPYWLLGGDGLILGPMLAISFVMFLGVPSLRRRGLLAQVGYAALLWLVVYIGIAGLAASINAQRERDDPGSFFGNLRLNGVSFGRCDVTVPKSYQPGSGVIPRPMRIATIELGEDPAQHIVLHEVLTLDEVAFFRRVRADVDRPENPDKEAFVFVHGFNNTFKDGVYRTALIARDLDFPGPALLFSWPSRGELEDYVADIDSVDYSKRHVREFIEKVSRHSGAKRVYLFAHSMGNVALTEALQRLFEREWPEKDVVKEVVFAAPDVLQDTFRDQILPDLRGKGPRLTLYASSHDVALATSRALHKGLRAGQGGNDIVLAPGLDTVDASALGKPLFDLGHNYAFATPSLRRDLQLLFKGTRPPREALTEKQIGELVYWLVRPTPSPVD